MEPRIPINPPRPPYEVREGTEVSVAPVGRPEERLKSVERSKASEAFKYLASVRAAQERYQAREGTYVVDLSQLDMTQVAPKYFNVGTVAPGSTSDLEDSWTLTMTRAGASSGYGAYTVTFTQDGYDGANSTIDGMSDINPMGSSPAP